MHAFQDSHSDECWLAFEINGLKRAHHHNRQHQRIIINLRYKYISKEGDEIT